MRIDVEQLGQGRVAAAALEGLEAGEQAAGRVGNQGDGTGRSTQADLVVGSAGVGAGVEESSLHLRAPQPIPANQVEEGIVDLHMEPAGEFVGEPALRGLVGPGLDGCDQGAVPGEPGGIVGPQSAVVEAGDLPESVEAAAVGITGQVAELLEFLRKTVMSVQVPRAFLRSGSSAILLLKKCGFAGIGGRRMWGAYRARGERREPTTINSRCSLHRRERTAPRSRR